MMVRRRLIFRKTLLWFGVSDRTELRTVLNYLLAKALAIDKSAVSRRAKDAESKGYLVNLEDQKGKPARLVLGDPLPEDAELLPAPENLVCCSVALTKGGIQE
jgi:hypothetical protein